MGASAAERLEERVVAGELRHECLGDAATDIDESEVAREGSILERREGDDLGARLLEQLEVFRVVEAEGVVECDADANRVGGRRWLVAARRVGGTGARGLHEALDEVEVAVAGNRVAELLDGRVDMRVLEEREQSRAQFWNAHRLHVRDCAEHRHACERPDGILDDATPVVVGDVVEDDADNASGAVELFDAERGGRRRSHRSPMRR